MDNKTEERLESLKESPKRKCTFADEGEREGYSYDIKDTDLSWMFETILKQKALIELQARIIDGMVSDAEEIKKLLLRANKCYVNNKDIEVNVNIIKALDVLKLIEV